jgi:hypothetical protein
MSPRKTWIVSALVVATVAAGGVSKIRSGPAEIPFFDPAQLRPGMVATGRTVFQGYEPEEFRVEILGVLKNAIGPQQDMILARLHGENVERTGVIAGMSGSPVMLDGKILGAVSYRLGSFEKEPIAGITPIADMVRAAEMPKAPATTASGSSLLEEWKGPESKRAESRLIPIPGMTSSLVPIGTPLVFAGFPESLIREVAPLFEARGLEPLAGAGGQAAGTDYPISPGVAISVPLVRGDLSVAATGTLTHVAGNKFWAFGHPFFGSGAVRYPVARAEVVVTYPSLLGSFKIANSTSLMGTLLQDRLTCIQGEIGPPPSMLPVTVTVDTPTGERRLAFEVARDDTLTPILTGITLQASLQRILEYNSETTLRAELRVESKGHPTLEHTMVESDTGGPQSAAVGGMARETATLLNVIYGNRFREAPVTSVRMRVSTVPEAHLARIGDLSISPSMVRPGETITVRVVLQPYRGADQLKEFKMLVPPDTPKGPLNVTVASARSLDGAEGALLQQRLAGAQGLDELIRFFNSSRRDDAIYLQLSRRSLGAVVEGEPLPTLPLSVLYTLASTRHSGEEYPAPDQAVMETSEPSEFVLFGGRRIAIQVR